MLRMPTAVLMMIGHTAVMKMTKIADGWLSRKAASEIGSQASGEIVRSTWNSGSRPRMAHTDWPMMVPSAMPMTPAKPDVLRAGDEERIHDQVARLAPDHCRRGQCGARPAAQDLPDDQQQRE